MGRKASGGINDARVKEVRNQITVWRRTRARRTAMPAELWAKTVALAQTWGTYPIARTLRVDYQSLARRIAEAGGERVGNAESVGFVEMRGADLIGGVALVEVSEADGARLTIRLPAGSPLDAAVLLGAFRRHGA